MPRREKLSPSNALLDVVVLALLAGIAVAVWLAIKYDAWRYYTAPVTTRGYSAAHRLLRPAGSGGELLGIAGTLVMFSTLFYVARKRVKRLSKTGSLFGWLQVHIFCGVFGPILITFHSSFKFNGVISVAYWSMVLVVLSGFVGRHLYVRIPKTIKGEELSRADVEARIEELKAQLAGAALPPDIARRLEGAEAALVAGAQPGQTFRARFASRREFRRREAALRQALRSAGLDRRLVHETLDAIRERALLLRRIGRLKKTRELFQVWHVFHRPLVWVMFLIFFVHLGVAIYFGYIPFMER